MTIELLLDGKNNIYTTKFISGMMFRKALLIEKKLQEDSLDVQLLDEVVGFVCMVFDNQFNANDFYTGIERKKLFSTAMNTVHRVISGEYDTH